MIGQKHRLLLIDDDPLVLEQVAVRLSSFGYEVTSANDGVEALLRIEEDEWDLVILDLLMPAPGGLEVLRQIRRSHSLLSLPVIMVTSQTERSEIIRALEAGANDYLIKPLDFDITLARIRTQLNCNELASAKDEFLSFASHDLKKPLMLMQDIAGELHRQFIPGTRVTVQAQKDLECLIRTARNMMGVVEGFLNKESCNSGFMQLELKPVCLNTLVQEVIQENTGYALSKGIILLTDVQPGVPDIQADALKLRGVIDNLIGNAIKFGPAKTKVTVSTHTGHNNVYLRVSDSGPGLSPSDLENLFTKHSTLSNKPTGHEISSGLGLFLCCSLVEKHGGRIGAENNPGQGATFWIALPVRDEQGLSESTLQQSARR